MKPVLFLSLMGIVIFVGLLFTLTPFIAESFFPAPENQVRQANAEDAQEAIRDILQSQSIEVRNAKAIRKSDRERQITGFSFETSREPIQRFIYNHKLKQQELSPEILDQVFFQKEALADWWKPNLGTETYFTKQEEKTRTSLIYNAKTQKVVLVIFETI